MKPIQLVGAIFVVLGIVAIALGGSWTMGHATTTHVGPMNLETGNTNRVEFPRWAGVGAILIGGLLAVYPLLRRKSAPTKAA